MKWLAKLIHSPDRKDRRYVSDTDKLLKSFDAAHPEKSASQIHEINKHRNIFNRSTGSRINWD